MTVSDLEQLIALGEGQLLEFKRSGTSHLGREICAFANSLGGRILIGVSDSGHIIPQTNSNALRSEIQSIARNLEPALMIDVEDINGVFIVHVPNSRFTLQRSTTAAQVDTAKGGPMSRPMGGPITLTDRQKEILELIKANPSISRRNMAKELNINPSAVIKHLDALKQKGILQRIGGTRGHWEVSIHF